MRRCTAHLHDLTLLRGTTSAVLLNKFGCIMQSTTGGTGTVIDGTSGCFFAFVHLAHLSQKDAYPFEDPEKVRMTLTRATSSESWTSSYPTAARFCFTSIAWSCEMWGQGFGVYGLGLGA